MEKKISPVKQQLARIKERIPKPFPSFDLWSIQPGRRNANGTFRCLKCEGVTKVIAPGEEPDPVEGHKLSTRIPCDRCKATGEEKPSEIRAYYLILKDDARRRRKEKIAIYKRMVDIFKKLTKEEGELLVLWHQRQNLL